MPTTNRPSITPPNSHARRVIRYAMDALLAPHTQLNRDHRPVHAGTVTVIVNGRGTDSPFGSITIGAKSGRVLAATLTYGNTGPSQRMRGGRRVLAEFRALAAATPPPNEPTRFDREELSVEVTELRDGDRLLDAGELTGATVAWHHEAAVTYSGVPGVGRLAHFHEPTREPVLFAAPQQVRISRRVRESHA